MYKLTKNNRTKITEISKNNRASDLRHQNTSEIPFRNSLYNGTESISYLGPNMWESLPESLFFIYQF